MVGVLPVRPKRMLVNLTQGVPFLDACWILMSKQADMSSSEGAFDAAVCLAMAHHPRLGAASPLRVLPPDVLKLIAKNVRHERRIPCAMLLTVRRVACRRCILCVWRSADPRFARPPWDPGVRGDREARVVKLLHAYRPARSVLLRGACRGMTRAHATEHQNAVIPTLT